VLRLGAARGAALVPHVRPKSSGHAPPGAAVVDLADTEALTRAMAGCTTVLQLIGTMRKHFSTGDTYETSDIGTTRQLFAAARPAGVDHFILLSSVGAGSPTGAYLRAKAEAERLVRESGLPFTLLRPSAFIGEGHRAPPLMKGLTRLLGLSRWEPIPIEELGAALLHVALTRAPLNAVLEGDSLWEVVRAARAA
jgi:uncharacterized protein YbjT (DUF2867 family)